jgi:helicase MOV-10
MIEVEKVIMYLNRIIKVIEKHPDLKPLLRNIGIITPYRKQVAKLKDACEEYKATLDIEIGTVEQFQGKEKVVIILSTVRSHMDSVGFLDSEKRFNVAMTRAKCLLITVGNPETLSKDSNWTKLVEFCDENGARIPRRQQQSGNNRRRRRR